jgi:hypothetical protein
MQRHVENRIETLAAETWPMRSKTVGGLWTSTHAEKHGQHRTPSKREIAGNVLAPSDVEMTLDVAENWWIEGHVENHGWHFDAEPSRV